MVSVEADPSVRVSDPELADALRNGGDTAKNRRKAIMMIASSQPGVMTNLLSALELAWRREGDIPDLQLDTIAIAKKSL